LFSKEAITKKLLLKKQNPYDLSVFFYLFTQRSSSKEKKIIVCFGSLYNVGNILNKN